MGFLLTSPLLIIGVYVLMNLDNVYAVSAQVQAFVFIYFSMNPLLVLVLASQLQTKIHETFYGILPAKNILFVNKKKKKNNN